MRWRTANRRRLRRAERASYTIRNMRRTRKRPARTWDHVDPEQVRAEVLEMFGSPHAP